MNIEHDVVQTGIHFLCLPAHSRGVLRHFQTGCCHAASVRRLAWRKQYARIQEQVGRFNGGGHICPFRYRFHAIANQRPGGIHVQFVLRRARQGDIHRHAPRLFTFQIGQAKLTGIIRYPTVTAGFDFAQTRQFFCRKASFIHHGTAGVGGGHHARAKRHRFLDSVLRHVAGAGDRHAHPLEAQPVTLKHRFGEIDQTITRRFRANQATAKRQTFAGKDAGAVVGELFHHPGHKAHFTPPHADIPGRNVGVRPKVAIELSDQRLAEAHHFAFALAFRIEITPAFTAAHRQGSERIFKGLLEAEEFQNRQVHRGVEAHPALKRPNGGVKLHAPRAVDLHLIAVVHPRHAELDDALRLYQTFKQRHLTVTRIFLKEGPQGGHDFTNGLGKLALVRVALLNMGKKAFQRACLIHRYKNLL